MSSLPNIAATTRSARHVARTKKSITIVIPCYNESESVAALRIALTELEDELSLDYNLKFIAVDDGSSDNTVWQLRSEFADWDHLTIVEHETNRGIAAAIATGISQAETEVVASMDSDCSYRPTQLANLLPLLQDDVDLVTASPYHPDGVVLTIPSWRLALSRFASRLYRLVCQPKLYTYTSCFRVYRRSSVLGLDIRDGGFVGVAEALWRLHLRGGRIVECPAELSVRQFGQSKMRILKTALGHLRFLSKVAFFRLFRSHCRNQPVPRDLAAASDQLARAARPASSS